MITDLDKLIEAVEGGDDGFAGGDDWLTAWGGILPQTPHDLRHETHWHIVAWKCLDGSLDAAMALHEALLPGWLVQELSQNSRSMGWNMLLVNPDGTYISSHYGDVGFISCPARAWLIATLKAYRAQVQK